MRNLCSIALIGILSAGCATTYYHPNKTDADFQRDKYQCETIANQRVADMGYAGNIFMVQEEIDKCLKIRDVLR